MIGTQTGINFERYIKEYFKSDGIDLTKHNLYKYLKNKGIDWNSIISRKILPDICYLKDDTLYVYEIKYQQVEGSTDEKPQTCGFKIYEYRKIANALGLKDVKYIYIFNSWFKNKKYIDMLNYIKSVEGCDYLFEEEIYGTE